MAKIPMRVIGEAEIGEREVHSSRGPGSAFRGAGGDGSRTYVCGRCRDILGPGLDLDDAIVSSYDADTDSVIPVSRFRDIVIRCKGCGACNEPPGRG